MKVQKRMIQIEEKEFENKSNQTDIWLYYFY